MTPAAFTTKLFTFIKLPFSNEVDAWAGLFLSAAGESTSQIIERDGVV